MSTEQMRIHVISLFPEIFEALDWGVIGQAQKHKKFEINCLNPRDYTEDVHKTVDDRPYGGGDGMLMLAEPLRKALEAVQTKVGYKPYVIHLSPQGGLWSQSKARQFTQKVQQHQVELVLICGRYAGIDQRFVNSYVDEEISVGDYILSGGEFAALSVIDSMVRLWPGVLGNKESSVKDSFSAGDLEAPQFTRPREFEGQAVPKTLLSGNHSAIDEWREKMGQLRTLCLRPDLVGSVETTSRVGPTGSTLSPTFQSKKSALEWAQKQQQEELKSCGVFAAIKDLNDNEDNTNHTK